MFLQALGLLSCIVCSAASADEFDLYTNRVLSGVPTSQAAEPVEKLTLAELFKANELLSDAKGCFLVVRTDENNWSKLLVGRAIRKHGESEQPIVVIHRFFTLRADSDSGRLAAGKGVYLFDGFQFNLDIGQVVPNGGGGDIEFHREGDTGGYLKPISKAKLYLIKQPLVKPPASQSAGPSRGPVMSEDFAGTYRLVANGQWSGKLKLEVAKSGDVTGSYLSDQTGRDYPVKGRVATPAHHIKFTVELPQAKQEFDGYMWTHGKSALAGVTTLAERQFGFVAVRDGAELMPKEE